MTTAISLWIVYVGAVALYVRAAMNGIAGGANPWRYVAGAPLVYLLVLGSITLLWFALAWAFRSPRPKAMQIGPGATLRLFWDEMWAIAASSRHMAMYRFLPGDPPAGTASAP